MTTKPNQMGALYRRMRKLGLPTPYVRSTILPAWWDDEAASTPAGLAEAQMILARNLGIEMTSLRDPEAALTWGSEAPVKSKRRSDTDDRDVQLARRLALNVAAFAALGTPQATVELPSKASQIRESILERGWSSVTLAALLETCWLAGIAVLHIATFPKAAKKPLGLATVQGERTVIIVCQKQRYSAWLAFHVAHELGHIVLGHVNAATHTLVDEEIGDYHEGGDDMEERAADAFAIELLTGNSETRFQADGRWPNARHLAGSAKKLGQEQQIDPGHVVLNYARTMGASFFSVANAALKIIEPNADATTLIREVLAANFCWDCLPGDASEFVMRMTGVADDAR